MINWDAEQVERAKKDFRAFIFIVWKEIGLPNPTPNRYGTYPTESSQ